MSKIEKKEILEALHFRHACKTFDESKIIPKQDFDLILESARLSPSAFGFNPWKFVVLRNKEILKGLVPPISWGSRRQAPSASHFIIVLARRPHYMRYDSNYIDDLMKRIQQLEPARHAEKLEVYKNFQENEFKLLESERALFDHSGKQCYLAMANMMYTAALLGIDSCAIEGFDPVAVEKYLTDNGVYDPKDFGLIAMMAFGYRKNDVLPKQRQEMSEIVDWVE